MRGEQDVKGVLLCVCFFYGRDNARDGQLGTTRVLRIEHAIRATFRSEELARVELRLRKCERRLECDVFHEVHEDATFVGRGD